MCQITDNKDENMKKVCYDFTMIWLKNSETVKRMDVNDVEQEGSETRNDHD